MVFDMHCDVCGTEEKNMEQYVFNLGKMDKAVILLCYECNLTYKATGEFPLTLHEIKQISKTE